MISISEQCRWRLELPERFHEKEGSPLQLKPRTVRARAA
jgi:hypothetical protein